MILAAVLPRNGRFLLLIGLAGFIIILFGNYRQDSHSLFLCLFGGGSRCHGAITTTTTTTTKEVGLPVGSSSPALGLGEGSNAPVLNQHHHHDSQQQSSFSSSETSMDLSLPDAPFIPWPLARLCAESPLPPSPSPSSSPSLATQRLVFLCDNNSGGIGNIRNFILTCLRYAIEAGATGVVLPTIQTRNEGRLDDLFRGKKLGFGHFFDEEVFRGGLGEACPGLEIYDGVDDVDGAVESAMIMEAGAKGKGKGKGPKMITPKHFGLRGGCDARDLNRHTDLFGERFRAWLLEERGDVDAATDSTTTTTTTTITTTTTPTKTTLIRFNWGVQWEWPVWRDGPEFVATFGGLLRFREDILQLGKEIVGIMERRWPQRKGEGKGAEAGGFLGMHLRTENDALNNWPSFDEQADAYLVRASSLDRQRLAYVATGNDTEAERFAKLAAAQGVEVVTKHQLLEEETELKQALDRLSWDQQGLVDYVVLLHAEFFLGVSPSSFSMNVALKRHLQKEGIYTRPWKVGSAEGDGRSWLVGKYENYWEDWLFMYDSLWP